WGYAISPRRITVSTVGLVPVIRRLIAETRVNLAVSLSATTDAQRARLMPVDRRYPLRALPDACRALPLPGRKRITFEYVIVGGAGRARRLAEIVGGDGTVRVTESLPAIQDVAREFRERGTEVLAICGGDGSYHCTLTVFRAVYGDAPLPLLLPLRAGTINYISDAIGG